MPSTKLDHMQTSTDTSTAADGTIRHIIDWTPNPDVPVRGAMVIAHGMAEYGKSKRWMSKDQKGWARNQRSAPYAGKQASRPRFHLPASSSLKYVEVRSLLGCFLDLGARAGPRAAWGGPGGQWGAHSKQIQ